MRATPFLSFAVDPDGPWSGLSHRARSIEVMPGGEAGGGLHLFQIQANGVHAGDVEALEACLAQRLHSVATVHFDRVTHRWHAEAVIDDASLQQSCLAIPLSLGAFEVPWIHIDASEASVRLLPKQDPDLFVLHARLEKALGRVVTVSYLDYTEYERWVRRLHVAA